MSEQGPDQPDASSGGDPAAGATPSPFSREGAASGGEPAPPPGWGPAPAAQQYGQPAPYGDPGYSYGQPPGYGAEPYPDPYSAGYPGHASPYGYPSPHGYAPEQHPRATMALILGLLGLLFCPPVGIAGLVVGHSARKEIDAAPQRFTGRGLATAGFVLGIVSVVYTTLLLVYLIVLIMVGAAGLLGY